MMLPARPRPQRRSHPRRVAPHLLRGRRATALLLSAVSCLSFTGLIHGQTTLRPEFQNLLYLGAPVPPYGTTLVQPAAISLISGHVGPSGDAATPVGGNIQFLQSVIVQSVGVDALPFLFPGVVLLAPQAVAAFAAPAYISFTPQPS